MAEYNSVNLGRIMPKYTGDYSTNVNYNTLDIVFYEGNSYIATQPSLRQTPAIDSEYWGLISGKGDKGDKGDTGPKGATGATGPAGKDAEMPVIGGRNYIPNSQKAGFRANTNVIQSVTVEKFDDATSMLHLVNPAGGSINAGVYIPQTVIKAGDSWTYSMDIKGTGVYSRVGINNSSMPTAPSGNVNSGWTRVVSSGVATKDNDFVVLYFNTKDTALDVYIKLPNLEAGNVATDWTPAPEDAANSANSLISRLVPFTDFADVAKNMIKYAGNWYVWGANNTILNSPATFNSYMTISVVPAVAENTGYIIVAGQNYNKSKLAIAVVNNGVLKGWEMTSVDSEVVHNTGNETIAGDKMYVGDNTYMGTNTFMDGLSLNGKNVVNGLTDTDWLDIPLAEGRTGTAKYKVSLGKVFVHIDNVKGIIAEGNNAQGQIGTLPVNPSPYYTRHIGQAGSTVRGITINPNGVIYVYSSMGNTMSENDSYILDTVLM